MILEYIDIFEGNEKHRVEAELTTEHSASSYGRPVIVLDDGGALDWVSWVSLGYRLVNGTEEEKEFLRKEGFIE
jgi:hypothetical protein